MSQRKKNQKKRKTRSRLSIFAKILIALGLFLIIHQFLLFIRFKDITDISVGLDRSINKVLLEHNVKLSDVTERFQTEKKENNIGWIKFTKKIAIPSAEFPAIFEALKETAEAESVSILDSKKTPNSAEVEIGIRGAVMIHLNFVFVEEKNKIAIIVDDVGYTKKIKPYLELDIPLTYAIIPKLAYSTFLAQEFERSEIPYIIHMPMEPESYPENDPGEIALLTGMNKVKIKGKLNAALKSVEGAPGLNNHMGSKFTSDSESMNILLKIIKEKDMFFVDSNTSGKTVGYEIALKLGVPTVKNNFYLDNKNDYDYIIKRLGKLKKLALKRKKTVVICHMTRKNTAIALKDYIGEIRKAGIEFVYVKDILE